jgi:hypothetical protein
MDARTREPQMGLTFEKVWATIMAMREEAEEMREEAREASKEFDRRMQESREESEKTEQILKETARVVRELSISVGGLNNSFGELAEHLVVPNIRAKFNALGYHFKDKDIDTNYRIEDEQGRLIAEIDILLENDDFIIAIEVKSKPKKADIDNFVRRLEILRNSEDRLQDKRKIRGAIAGAVFADPVKKAVQKAGFYTIAQTGDTMKIDVPEDFKPKEW